MRIHKFCFLLILIIMSVIICMGCKIEQNQTNKKFPEGLDEIGCASLYEADLEKKVTDKAIIDEFTNMLNECVFRESSEEIPDFETNEDKQRKMGIVQIKMGDLVFYLESNGRYRNSNDEKYYYLENFDQELFEKFFMARQADKSRQ